MRFKHNGFVMGFIAALLMLIPGLIPLSCGMMTGNGMDPSSVRFSAVAATEFGTRLIVSESFAASAVDDRGNVFRAWSLVSASLNDVAIPLAAGEPPEIDKLRGWTDGLPNLPIDNVFLAGIQLILNQALAWIPTGDLREAIDSNGADAVWVIDTIAACLFAMQSAIDGSLERYEAYSAIPERPGAAFLPPEGERFSVSFEPVPVYGRD